MVFNRLCKEVALLVFCLFTLSLWSQVECDCIYKEDVKSLLSIDATINIIQDRDERKAQCAYLIDQKGIFTIEVLSNEVYSKFPDLFSKTIDTYLKDGEIKSKRKPELGTLTYTKINSESHNLIIHESAELVRLYWITDGHKLYKLDVRNPMLIQQGRAQLLELIHASSCF